jgi:uncharacterized membrane protein
MNKGARLFGHPIHPMLVVFPLGLLSTSVIFDVIGLIADSQPFHLTAFYMLTAGIIGGMIAAIFGLVDWLAIPAKTTAKRVGVLHGITNVVMLSVFIVAGFLRGEIDNPQNISVIVAAVALAIATFSGWLGAELVFRHAVGVANHQQQEGLSAEEPA